MRYAYADTPARPPDRPEMDAALVDESLALSEALGIPITVYQVDGDLWAFLANTDSK